MTTPHQSAPDGAVSVGGGTWNYGQTMNEDIGRSLFEFPMPTFDNMLDLLRLALERLPIDALQPWADFLGIVDGVFSSVGQAVDEIIGALVENVGMTVQAFGEWLTEFFSPLSSLFNQLLDVLQGNVVVPINEAISGIIDWFTGLPSVASVLAQINERLTGAFDDLLGLFNWVWNLFTNINPGDLIDTLFKPLAEFGAWLWESFGATAETVLKPLLGWLDWLWTSFGAASETFLKPIFTWLQSLWGLFGGNTSVLDPLFTWLNWLWAQFGSASETFLKPVFNFLDWLWGSFGSAVETFLKPVLNWLEGLWSLFGGTAVPLDGLFGWLKWVWDSFGSVAETFLKPVFDWLDGLWSLFGGTAVSLDGLFGWLKWVWDNFGEAVETFLKPIFGFFDWAWTNFGSAVETFMKPVLTWLNWLWTNFGSAVDTFLKPVFTWLEWLWSLLGNSVLTDLGNLFNSIVGMLSFANIQGYIEDVASFFTGILNPGQFVQLLKDLFSFFDGFNTLFSGFDILESVADFFSGVIGTAGSIADWADSILDLDFLFSWVKRTFSDPIIRALTGIFDVPDFGALATWARDLLTGNSPLNPLNLVGQIPAVLLGQVPVSAIGFESPNLLAQGSFAAANGVIEADGWTWEPLAGRGDPPGCVKALANGVTKTLYSTQSIPVAEDQVIETSCYITTAGFTGTATSIQLVLIPFFEDSDLDEIVVAQRNGYNTTWIQMVGSDYTVPSNVTSVRIALRVTSAATAGHVLWDDVSVKKTGLMGQSLVDSLINAWEGIWTGVFGSGGDGKIWSDMEAAIGTVSEIADTAAGDAGEAIAAAGDADDKAVVADILAAMAGAANNMIVSPDMEEPLIARGRWNAGAGSSAYTFGYSTEQARSGTQSMKLSATGDFASGAFCAVNFSPRKSGLPDAADGLTHNVVPGQVYNYDVEFYVTGTGTALEVGPGFKVYKREYPTVLTSITAEFDTQTNPAKNTWHRLSGSYTIPAVMNPTFGEPFKVLPVFFMRNPISGDTVYIDRFVIWR